MAATGCADVASSHAGLHAPEPGGCARLCALTQRLPVLLGALPSNSLQEPTRCCRPGSKSRQCVFRHVRGDRDGIARPGRGIAARRTLASHVDREAFRFQLPVATCNWRATGGKIAVPETSSGYTYGRSDEPSRFDDLTHAGIRQRRARRDGDRGAGRRRLAGRHTCVRSLRLLASGTGEDSRPRAIRPGPLGRC